MGKAAAKAAAAFYAAKGVIAAIEKTIHVSSQLTAVGGAFENLTAGIGGASDTLDKLQKATDGTVDSIDLMTQANNAMLLGIFDSNDQMAEMFDVAQRLGAAMGKDTLFGVESLVTGMGRQSKLMLDNLGIMIDLNKVNEEYAKSVGKTVKQLTDEEKKRAFNNATIEEAKRLVEGLGEEQLTTADRIRQLQSAGVDLAGTIGKELTPVFNATLDILGELSIHANKMAVTFFNIDFKATGKNILDNTQIFSAMNKIIDITIDLIPDLFRTMIDKIGPHFIKLMEGLTNAVKNVAFVLWEPLAISFTHIGSVITNGFRTVINGLIEGINFLSGKINFIGEKLGFDEIPEIDLLEKVKVDPLLDKLEDTKIAEKLFGGEDQIQTVSEAGEAIAEVYANLFEELTIFKEEEVEQVIVAEEVKQEAIKKTAKVQNELAIQQMETLSNAAKTSKKLIDQGMKFASQKYAHEKTLRDNDMNAEIKAIMDSTLNEEKKEAAIELIKEKYRQKDIEAQKALKPMKVAQAISNTALAVTGALGSPPFSPTNLALAALIGATGALEVKTIQAQEFATGGIVPGVGSKDTVPAMLTPGELILNKSQQENLAGSMGGITLNVSAPLVDDTILDTIIPAIEKAQKMNLA